jgi:hypothetical protein
MKEGFIPNMLKIECELHVTIKKKYLHMKRPCPKYNNFDTQRDDLNVKKLSSTCLIPPLGG